MERPSIRFVPPAASPQLTELPLVRLAHRCSGSVHFGPFVVWWLFTFTVYCYQVKSLKQTLICLLLEIVLCQLDSLGLVKYGCRAMW